MAKSWKNLGKNPGNFLKRFPQDPLRRVMDQQTNDLYEFGGFRLDARERLLLREGEPVPLTPKAFDVLLALVRRPGRLLEKEELFKEVWPDVIVEESTLSSNIALIRKVLGEGSDGKRFIETAPKRGYRFVAEVRLAEPASRHELTPGKPDQTANETPAVVSSASTHLARRWVLPSILVTLGLLAGSVAWFAVSHRSPETPAPPTIVPFTTLPGAESLPSFSPDGNQIAFVWNGEKGDNEDIYVKLFDAERPLRLTSDPAIDTSPAWSPDGRSIAFLRRLTRGSEIYLVPVIGGPERKLAGVNAPRDEVKGNRSLAWSPDGEFLAVVETPSLSDPFSVSNPFSIYLHSVKTNNRRRLTSPPSDGRFLRDIDPAISPDGKMLAFARSTLAGVSHEIFLVPLAGGEPKQLTFDDRYIQGLTWTGDGREIVYSSGRGGVASLWKIPVKGGRPEPLTGIGQRTSSPAIATRGDRMAFTEEIVDTNIWSLDLSGPAGSPQIPTRLISSTRQDNSPHYSQEGKKLVFISNRSGSAEIWTCDSDGSRPIQLTHIENRYVGTPRLSPDGRQIVFDSRDQGTRAIFVMSSDGGPARRLTPGPSENILPSWSRDGRWVYFMSSRDGTKRVWKIPAQGGQATPVTNQGGIEGFESFDGKFFYFQGDIQGQNDLWRIPLAGGEEIQVPINRTILPRKWVLGEQGIYFVTIEPPARQVIEFFSFATQQVTRVFTPEKEMIAWGPPDLAISPDGRQLLFTQVDQKSSDIMRVENFR
jgi:Tol biopolymer transport system component/DNA-binding winged helix-turn-helix (wHTH) protein